MLELRKRERPLTDGSLKILAASRNAVAFLREHEGRRLACCHGLTGEAAGVAALPGRVIFATDASREGEHTKGEIELRGNDALVVELT